MKRNRANQRRIHELEYELGIRDDPPPQVVTDAPGAIYEYRSVRQPHLSNVDAVLKQVWTDDRAADIAGPGTRLRKGADDWTWHIATEGHDHVTHVRIEPHATSIPRFCELVDLELQDALRSHKDAITLASSPDPADCRAPE